MFNIKQLMSAVLLMVIVFFGTAASAEFTEPIAISQPDGLTVYHPDLAEGPDGKLHATWQGDLIAAGTRTSSSIFHSVSEDNGATWSSAVAVKTVYDRYGILEGPKVVIDKDGVIHLAYDYLNGYGYGYMIYSRSADNGLTWTSVNLQSGCFPWDGHLGVDENKGVFLAWSLWKCGRSTIPDTVFLSRSSDGGVTMGSPTTVVAGQTLTNRQQGGDVRSLHVDRTGTMHLLYAASAYSMIASGYLTSADQGQTWHAVTTLPEGFAPRGIFGSGDAIVLSGSSNGSSAMIRSRDNGATWEGPFIVPADTAPYYFSQIVTDGENRYYTRLDKALYRSDDGGATWRSPEDMGSSQMLKMVYTSKKELLVVGIFNAQVGMVRHYTLPKIAADPSAVDFGSLQVPGSLTRKATISNQGGKDLIVTSIGISGADAAAFSQMNTCTTVAPGTSCEVTITFTATKIGVSNASLDIASDDPRTPLLSLNLAGQGIDLIAPLVSISATPGVLHHGKHKTTKVTIAGTATDSGSGIASVVITVFDEYGVYNMTVPGFGSTIRLGNRSRGRDLDGRLYTITAVVTDNAGNISIATTTVIAKHDRRGRGDDDRDDDDSERDPHGDRDHDD